MFTFVYTGAYRHLSLFLTVREDEVLLFVEASEGAHKYAPVNHRGAFCEGRDWITRLGLPILDHDAHALVKQLPNLLAWPPLVERLRAHRRAALRSTTNTAWTRLVPRRIGPFTSSEKKIAALGFTLGFGNRMKCTSFH